MLLIAISGALKRCCFVLTAPWVPNAFVVILNFDHINVTPSLWHHHADVYDSFFKGDHSSEKRNWTKLFFKVAHLPLALSRHVPPRVHVGLFATTSWQDEAWNPTKGRGGGAEAFGSLSRTAVVARAHGTARRMRQRAASDVTDPPPLPWLRVTQRHRNVNKISAGFAWQADLFIRDICRF